MSFSIGVSASLKSGHLDSGQRINFLLHTWKIGTSLSSLRHEHTQFQSVALAQSWQSLAHCSISGQTVAKLSNEQYQQYVHAFVHVRVLSRLLSGPPSGYNPEDYTLPVRANYVLSSSLCLLPADPTGSSLNTWPGQYLSLCILLVWNYPSIAKHLPRSGDTSTRTSSLGRPPLFTWTFCLDICFFSKSRRQNSTCSNTSRIPKQLFVYSITLCI